MKHIAIALLMLPLVVAPVEAQFGPMLDADTLRAAGEINISSLIIVVFAALVTPFMFVLWRTVVGVKSALAAAQAQAATDGLARAARDDADRKERDARDAADRKERDGYLALLWQMQGTHVQAKEAILIANTGYKAQTDALKAHTDALTAHTAEDKAFRAELDREFKSLKKSMSDGHDKIGNMVKDGIVEALKGAAEIFAEHNRAAIGPLANQIALLNERLAPQNNGEDHEGVSDSIHAVSGTDGRISDRSGPADGSVPRLADGVGGDAGSR